MVKTTRAIPRHDRRMDDATPDLTASVDPQVLGPLRIVGLAQDFTEANKAAIPALWGRLFGEPGVAARATGRTFGVCRASPEEGCDLRYLAGFELSASATAPADLEIIELPARPYAVFTMKIDGGDLHLQMQAAARAIWGELLPASGLKLAQAPDLEVYPAGFDPTQAGAALEWWIPVLA